VKTAIDTFGSLDVVVNNAGYGNLSSVEIVPGLVESGGSRLRARYATCSC